MRHLTSGKRQDREGAKAQENLATAATMYREMGMDLRLAQAEAETETNALL